MLILIVLSVVVVMKFLKSPMGDGNITEQSGGANEQPKLEDLEFVSIRPYQ